MACYAPCADCDGTGLLSDPVEPCVYCDGLGELPSRRRPAAELREMRRLIERYLFEPGYAMAYLFLSARPKKET